jgi:phage terminase Nu1 subunit (DNA packaging protein)
MRSNDLALSGAPSQVSTRKPPRTVNKGECCRHFRWTRHEFDRKVREGMPVVEAAANKGREWRVNIAAVSRWLREREAEAAERQRRYEARRRQEQEELERALARMSEKRRRALLPRWAR